MKYYNVHVHLFGGAYVPAGFYGREKAGWFRRIRHTIVGEYLIWILEWINPFNYFDSGNKLASLIRKGNLDSMEDNFLELKSVYSDWPEMQFVVLSLDTDFMGGGKPEINFKSQLNELVLLNYRYPNQIIPFISIDPRRDEDEGLLDFVKKYIGNKGFRGIKMYPALGFYPFDHRLHEVYTYAEDLLLPIITHCDRGGINFQGKRNPYTKSHIKDEVKVLNKSKNDQILNFYLEYFYEDKETFWHGFTEPLAFFDILKKYPELKICFAHFGGDVELHRYRKNRSDLNGDGFSKLLDKYQMFTITQNINDINDDLNIINHSWFEQICLLMILFPNVYADVSYTLYDDSLFPLLKKVINDKRVGSKVLFGTDYYLTERRKSEKRLLNDFIDSIGIEDFQKISSTNAIQFLKTKEEKKATN